MSSRNVRDTNAILALFFFMLLAGVLVWSVFMGIHMSARADTLAGPPNAWVIRGHVELPSNPKVRMELGLLAVSGAQTQYFASKEDCEAFITDPKFQNDPLRVKFREEVAKWRPPGKFVEECEPNGEPS